jgi:hypothetical protein
VSPARVPSNDVLDPNARVRRPFRARPVGRYERVGPNVWDDYAFVAEAGEPIGVRAGVLVQLEPGCAVFRMRLRGQVHVLEWLPAEEDGQQPAVTAAQAARLLRERHIEEYASPPPLGPAVVIAKKLEDD